MRKYYGIAAALFFLAPLLLEACPMCQGGEGFSKPSIFAYKLTTVVLGALPLVMGAGIFLWLRRKMRSVR